MCRRPGICVYNSDVAFKLWGQFPPNVTLKHACVSFIDLVYFILEQLLYAVYVITDYSDK